MQAGIAAHINPYARLATALAPFAAAVLLRIAFGDNRTTRALLTLATSWFAVNILLAPYTVELQRGIYRLVNLFR